jgi:CDP-glucose 4,6-dehydratase
VVTALLEHLPGKWIDKSTINAPHEARFLHLSTDKANKILNWQSKWNFAETIRHTADWYHCYLSGGNVRSLTQQQIELFAG